MDEVTRVEKMARSMRALGVARVVVGDLEVTLGPPPTERERLLAVADTLPPDEVEAKTREIDEAEEKRAAREELELELASSGMPVTDELAEMLGAKP